MIKKLASIILFFLLISNIALAVEKIPILITPSQIISTDKDEIEFGDSIEFKVAKDVYKDDRLCIKKGAPVVAEVDYVSPNGWAGDSAFVLIKKFKIFDSNNKWINVPYTLKISGRNCKNPAHNFLRTGFHYLAILIRGDEVFLNPNQQNFNIFMVN